MKRVLIVSNRLPVSVSKTKAGVRVKPSVGGLATGMKSIYAEMDSCWIGWPGIDEMVLTTDEKNEVLEKLTTLKCEALYIDKRDMDLYYSGFSNKTIWPLFHYFPQYVVYDQKYWEAYLKVNHLFAEKIFTLIREDDHIWIHDYHLLLLPKLIKDRYPNATIGFFNHIPFPSFELFRLLPWRKKLLQGMLGADLIGFHSYDYERHFNSCVRRLLGYDYELNQFNLGHRIIRVDNFPMGIDYERFHRAALKLDEQDRTKVKGLKREIHQFFKESTNVKLVLSIDRMDYSKGIPNRLYAFQRFLEKYPEYRSKVSLIMLAVPSRSKVSHYQKLKKEVDELVGNINGKYGDINWTPILYFYRSMDFENLVQLYHNADIALVTPLRDGMNLVAKEFIATKTDGTGVIILSEMAGSAKEMNEALLINPNNLEEIADAIKNAIIMPEVEQINRNSQIQRRLRRYSVERWASEFMRGLKDINAMQHKYASKLINENAIKQIQRSFENSEKRILFLDYNGTLVYSEKSGEYATPDTELYQVLDKFARDKTVDIVLMSSRDKDILEQWFGRHDFLLFAEHGMWKKTRDKRWHQTRKQLTNDWKNDIRPVIESYVDRTPGSYLEEMNNVLSWHFEKADPDHGRLRAYELKDELAVRILNMDLQILEGKEVIEIKPAGMNKGIAALQTIMANKYDFVMAIGDDWTDEYLFELLPDTAITIRVGMKKTHAIYNCQSYKEVRKLLKQLGTVSTKKKALSINPNE